MKLFPHQEEALDRAPVVGFEGLYEVDTLGNVYSIIKIVMSKTIPLKTLNGAHSQKTSYIVQNWEDIKHRNIESMEDLRKGVI